MKRGLIIIFVIAAIGVGVFSFRNELGNFLPRLVGQLLPCAEPITYRIGSFDPRFGISKSAFLGAVTEAEAIWEKPVRKNLFSYAPNGTLTINLVYDFRQAATQKLKALGIVVGGDKTSYNEVKSKYDAMRADYAQQKSAYDARVAAFQGRETKYETEVAYWNNRGDISQNIFDQLNAEKASLTIESAAINTLQANLNAEATNINAIVVALNRLVVALNLNVGQFNAIGQTQGAEFEEGVYISDGAGQAIDIYQFDTNARLVRVLAHELGHALGLPHVADPKAIMYRLNESINEKLTSADLSELQARCGIPVTTL